MGTGNTGRGGASPSWRFGRTARKPDGGFCFITVRSLLRAWEAYRDGEIRLVDLRVWLAAVELVARRCELQNGQKRRYQIDELAQLLGGSRGSLVRQCVSRLEVAGLLAFSESAIRYEVPSTPGGFTTGVPERSMGRKVPVPRRIIRHLAEGTSRAVVATVFAHLIRCLRYRKGECVSGGFCKASWVSEVFGIHLRSVKAARKRLIQQGWLVPAACPQRILNGLGMGVEIGFNWSGGPKPRRTETAPPGSRRALETPPPMKNVKLSSRPEMQKPSTAALSGSHKAVASHETPTLTNIVHGDLADDRRLLSLFLQAIERKWVRDCDSDRLNFWAAAEHARAIGNRNVPGLFVWVVKHRRWSFITQRDEDCARSRITSGASRLTKQVYHRASPESLSPAAVICANVLGRLEVQRTDSIVGSQAIRRASVPSVEHGVARQT